MSTKAEVQAAIEAIAVATEHAAAVASALDEGTPPQTEDVLITEQGNDLLVTSKPPITEVLWTLVDGVAPWGWYGPKTVGPTPLTIVNPQYQRDGDFVKVLYGPDFTQSVDGPKDTTAVAPPLGGSVNVIRDWRMGHNIERFRPGFMTWQGHLLTQPNYYRDYLPTIGCNWVRFFIPFGSENDMGCGTEVCPSVNQFADIIQAARVASESGQGVSLGLTDVLEAWSIDQRWDAVQENVRNVARECAIKLDPAIVVLETANELGGGDNPFWNDKRNRLHEIIREECPNHRIAHGCANWNNNSWGDDWAEPPDRNVVLRYHRYERGNWWKIDGCKQQAEKLGTLIYGGEVMPEFGNGNLDEWGQNWMDCLANGGHACGGWAVTDGRDFQMSVGGTDATLRSELEEWSRRVAADYR